MRFYEKVISKPIPVALFIIGFIVTNPFHIPPDPVARAEEPVVVVLVERTPEASKAYAQSRLGEFGWDTAKQWQCLEDLWTKESNWRPDAFNKTAVYQNGEKLHAGGIPQILGLDPKETVEEQIRRGLVYIEHRYSNPCAAWRFWSNNFWYLLSSMEDEHKRPSAIDNALAEIGRIAFLEPAICTGWVLVSEWMGEGDKDYWTLTLADDQNPDWRHRGLVHHCLHTWEDNDDVGLKDEQTDE